MAEAEKAAKAPHPFSPEGMLAHIERWESDYLLKVPMHQANNELARLQETLRKIGERLSRKQQAESRNRCSECHKPLDARGPYMTVPIYDFNRQNWVNQNACSSPCSEKLQQKARAVQNKIAAGA